MERETFSQHRDRHKSRYREMARLLENPTPANVELVRKELERLARS